MWLLCDQARGRCCRTNKPSPPFISTLPQLLILLEFFYSVNEWLVERDQCAWALVAGSAFLIVGAFVGIGFLYHVCLVVAGRGECNSSALVHGPTPYCSHCRIDPPPLSTPTMHGCPPALLPRRSSTLRLPAAPSTSGSSQA